MSGGSEIHLSPSPRDTNRSLRETSSACIGAAFVLGAAALGVLASKDGSPLLAVVLGAPAIVLPALCGIVRDSQHPRTQTLGERALQRIRHLAVLAAILIWVSWTVTRI